MSMAKLDDAQKRASPDNCLDPRCKNLVVVNVHDAGKTCCGLKDPIKDMFRQEFQNHELRTKASLLEQYELTDTDFQCMCCNHSRLYKRCLKERTMCQLLSIGFAKSLRIFWLWLLAMKGKFKCTIYCVQ